MLGEKFVHMLCIGNSHVVALKSAYDWNPSLRSAAGSRGLKADFICFLFEEYALDLQEGASILNARTSALIEQSSADVIVSSVGGSEHIIFGLVNHPRRFDFVLGEKPDLPVDTTADVVPCNLIRMVLERKMDVTLRVLRAIRALTRKPIVHVESPPPIPEFHVRKYPTVFRERIDNFGVAPAGLRYKLWRLHSEIMRKLCAESGALFMPVPPEAQDGDGMMAVPALGADAAHANAWYGSAVLRQLLRNSVDFDPAVERLN